jgi:hypothetical protein
MSDLHILPTRKTSKLLLLSYIHAYFHTHTYEHTLPWIYKCVIATAECGTCHTHTHIQIYSVKYYNNFTKILEIIFTHEKDVTAKFLKIL